MPNVADIAVTAMQVDQDRLRIIGQNLANASTPGYQAEIPALDLGLRFESYLATQNEQGLPLHDQTMRSKRPGSLQQTNRALDLSLEGAGYFELMTDSGIAYTRRGDFHIDANGVLRGSRDYAVMGSAGPITLPDSNVMVKADGSIEKDGAVIARLAVAQFQENTSLTYGGDGLFFTSENPDGSSDSSFHVRQGYVEAANVQPMVEMTHMLEVTRHFGAAAQALKAYDQMMDSALSGLGQF